MRKYDSFSHGTTKYHNVEYSRTSIIRASINRASHRYVVPLHFQYAGGVVSG
jgi:hypothetical protein